MNNLKSVLELVGEVDVSHLVVGRLADMASRYPLEAVKLMNQIVEGDQKGGGRIRGMKREKSFFEKF